MLFSALHLSESTVQSSFQCTAEPVDTSARASFLTIAGRALVTGRYQRSQPYSVEAILLYAICKVRHQEESAADSWMLMGEIARLAMRMGYHRDPRHFPNISPFEGEMRRRAFYTISTLDILLSFQAGLPAIIHEDECDTEVPRNLFDADFGEDCKTVPPSRPYSDPTPIIYYCCKYERAALFRRVVRHALSLRPSSYTETMRLDDQLRDARSQLPPSLQMKPMSSLITDEGYNILNRTNIELMYLTSLCVLHRHYLNYQRLNPSFEYSRSTAADAALRILGHQAELHSALQPGGRFSDDKWMLTALTLHDFLLGAMVTCLDLYESHKRPTMTTTEVEAQIKKYDALKHSHGIWESRKESSRDARRASNVLAIMLQKVPRPTMSSAETNTGQQRLESLGTPKNGGISSNGAAPLSGDSSWTISGTIPTPDPSPSASYDALNNRDADPLISMFQDADGIDWVSPKNYVLLWVSLTCI